MIPRGTYRGGLTTLLCVAASCSAWSATITWTGATADWSVAANWSPAQVPALGDVVDIPSATNPPVVDANTPALCSGLILRREATVQLMDSAALYIVGPGDLDNDGISDLDEAQQRIMDVDEDGVPNFADEDSDGDGMSDGWEYTYGSPPYNGPFDPYRIDDALADYDGDGHTNLEESKYKTDPTDPNSYPIYVPQGGYLALALAACAVVLLAVTGLRRGGRWSQTVCVIVAAGALALSGGLLLAAGGGAGQTRLVDFSLEQKIHTVVAAASPGDTIQITGGSSRPWNGASTYVTKAVTLRASDGDVYLGGMRTALDVAIMGEGRVDATSLYMGSDHTAPVSQSVAYAAQSVGCFLGERLILTAVADSPGAFHKWSGDAYGDVNVLTFQVGQAGLGVVAEFSPPGPDLSASWGTNAPGTVRPGDTLSLNVTIENIGLQATTETFWTDSLCLSRDALFDPGDLILATSGHSGALAAGASYTAAFLSVAIPDVAPGQYYILLVTDASSQVTEASDKDNVAAAGLSVLDAVLAR